MANKKNMNEVCLRSMCKSASQAILLGPEFDREVEVRPGGLLYDGRTEEKK